MITKENLLESLMEIRKQGVDVSPEMRRVITNDTIQYESIIFVNKYLPIDDLFTYNKIYEKRKNNPLFKNLVNENLPTEEKAIALSSFQTQALIRIKELTKQGRVKEAKKYAKTMQIENISNALSEYAQGDKELIESISAEIRETFKKLYY